MKRKRYTTANEDYLLGMVEDVVKNLEALITKAKIPEAKIGDTKDDKEQDTKAKKITAADDRNVSAVMYVSSASGSDDESEASGSDDESEASGSDDESETKTYFFAANTSVVGAAEKVLGKDCVIIKDTITGKHAEMKIMDYFFHEQRLKDMGYIGISKPCCLGCAAVIAIAQQKEVPVTVKGTHKGTYGTGWVLPDYIGDDAPSEEDHDGTTRFESFMGKDAMTKYWAISPDSRREFLSRLNTRIDTGKKK